MSSLHPVKDNAPVSPTTPAPPDPLSGADAAWDALVAAARAWAEHLDQWDKFKFQTDYGPVYVTVGREDPYPDSFEDLS
jgi:hypothetical protein